MMVAWSDALNKYVNVAAADHICSGHLFACHADLHNDGGAAFHDALGRLDDLCLQFSPSDRTHQRTVLANYKFGPQ